MTTRVHALPHVSSAVGANVFIKRDDETDAELGGGKVRKLRALLADALARRATHLLTVGATGSNHVLATAWYGRAAGLEVRAALVPYPVSEHGARAAAAALSCGLQPTAAWSEADAVTRMGALGLALRARGARPYWLPPGGTSQVSVRGTLDCGRELVQRFDTVFCGLGSGGLAAALWASLPAATRLHAVRVYPTRLVGARYLRRLVGAPVDDGRLTIDGAWVGAGYGAATEAGANARQLFARDGIVLDPTYTAKVAAALVHHAKGDVLLWYSEPRTWDLPASG